MSSTTSRSGQSIAAVDRERRLALALGAGLLAAPFGALAQQPGRVWRIGFLTARPAKERSTASSPIAWMKLRLGRSVTMCSTPAGT